MTVGGATFGSGWIFTYDNYVQGRCVIAANYVKCDLLVLLCCYGRLHVCAYSVPCSDEYSGRVVDV